MTSLLEGDVDLLSLRCVRPYLFESLESPGDAGKTWPTVIETRLIGSTPNLIGLRVWSATWSSGNMSGFAHRWSATWSAEWESRRFKNKKKNYKPNMCSTARHAFEWRRVAQLASLTLPVNQTLNQNLKYLTTTTKSQINKYSLVAGCVRCFYPVTSPPEFKSISLTCGLKRWFWT